MLVICWTTCFVMDTGITSFLVYNSHIALVHCCSLWIGEIELLNIISITVYLFFAKRVPLTLSLCKHVFKNGFQVVLQLKRKGKKSVVKELNTFPRSSQKHSGNDKHAKQDKHVLRRESVNHINLCEKEW